MLDYYLIHSDKKSLTSYYLLCQNSAACLYVSICVTLTAGGIIM